MIYSEKYPVIIVHLSSGVEGSAFGHEQSPLYEVSAIIFIKCVKILRYDD